MKKCLCLICLLMMLAVCLISLAAPAGTTISCDIQDGNYVIRIPGAQKSSWSAYLSYSDGTVRALETLEEKDGALQITFIPDQDGEVTLTACHYHPDTSFCDEKHTWDLEVKDSKVTSSTGGSYTAAPAEDELDPFLLGTWKEVDTQFTQMNIVRDNAGPWNIEIISPMTHGAYVLKALMSYDCDQEALAYMHANLYDLPAEGTVLAAPRSADMEGVLTLTEGENGTLLLSWTQEGVTDSPVVFEKISGEADLGYTLAIE